MELIIRQKRKKKESAGLLGKKKKQKKTTSSHIKGLMIGTLEKKSQCADTHVVD